MSWRGWTKLVTIERNFALKIRDILKDIIEKYHFDGVKLSKVEMEWTIDNRRADIVIMLPNETPLLVIELKRKKEEKVTTKSGLTRATDRSLIGQVISYAYLAKKAGIKIPFIATANPEKIAVFEVPENLEDFVDPRAVRDRDYHRVIKSGKLWEFIESHGLLYEKISLTNEYFTKLLDTLVGIYVQKYRVEEKRTPLTYRAIEFFRDFVYWLTDNIIDIVKRMYENELKEDLEELKKRIGYIPAPDQLAREMAYIFMNKLIFYKILERYYKGLEKLRSLTEQGITSAKDYKDELDAIFCDAIRITGDFQPIFITGIYDKIQLPDDPIFLAEIDDFIETLDEITVEKLGDIIGYIYEELIPPEERHQLGQFYTPPAIAELITKWAIRSPNDVVLDPGCGSGTFLIEAYKRLVKLKTGKDLTNIKYVKPEIHEKILEQLYGIDINEFPVHLTAINLTMRNPRAPSTKLRVIKDDFFNLSYGIPRYMPYTIKTAEGEKQVIIQIPEKFDAVVGNPPYTRWVEIPEQTQELIVREIGDLLSQYKLKAQLSRGVEPGIYIHFIMHATKFLKNGGRLGMIISNLWLQTDYGIKFANLLLDHYKIRAIIDFTLRLFTALISTCILLLEKEEDEKTRNKNEVILIRIPGEIEDIKVDEILKILKEKTSDKYFVRVLKQKDMPRDEKWIKLFFLNIEEVYKHPLMVKLENYFDVSRGNTFWSVWALKHGHRPDPGASAFFYLSVSDAKEHNLMKYAYPNVSLNDAILYPAIVSARYAEHFTFTENDWKKLMKKDKRCYMFVCHKPREKLPKPILEYIRKGETEIKTRIRGSRKGGRLASETEAAKIREKYKEKCKENNEPCFYGWYDIGTIIYAPIFAIRQAWWKTRFVKCSFPVAMYDALIALIPKESAKFSDMQINALLAYLNSSFSQYYIELRGRRSGGGIIGFEVNVARDMPILDPKKLKENDVQELSELFNRLEIETRKIGGALRKEQIEVLQPIIAEIDRKIGSILGISENVVTELEREVKELISRRTRGIREAKPEAVRGEEERRHLRPKKEKKKREKKLYATLDNLFEDISTK